MLTVSGPGVTLNHTTQSVYRTMSVSVTATLSGSATSGTWTSSGTGSFSGTNALATVYTPSAADVTVGNVTLTFTTTGQAASCAAATATDVITLNQAVNFSKIVIIKADDFKVPLQAWTNFLQVCRDAGIKVSLGVIVSNIVGNAATAQWMQAQQAMGDVEFWDHGWDHSHWTATVPTRCSSSDLGEAAESSTVISTVHRSCVPSRRRDARTHFHEAESGTARCILIGHCAHTGSRPSLPTRSDSVP